MLTTRGIALAMPRDETTRQKSKFG